VPRKSVPKKIKKPTHKQLKAYLDQLWSLCVKVRAGFRSELSGKTEALQSHHLLAKPNYVLRYSLDNGISVTSGEHHYGFHNPNRQYEYNKRVEALRGKNVFDKLYDLKVNGVALSFAEYREQFESLLTKHQVDFEHLKKKHKINE
jgi:hypothetical protein